MMDLGICISFQMIMSAECHSSFLSFGLKPNKTPKGLASCLVRCLFRGGKRHNLDIELLSLGVSDVRPIFTPMALSISIGLKIVENARVAILDCHYCLSRIMCLNFVLKDFRCPSLSAIRHPVFAFRDSLWGKTFSLIFVRYIFCQLNASPLIGAANHQCCIALPFQ